MNTPQVTWLPEHPVSGSMSMQRYWRKLEAEIRPGDPFRQVPVFPPDHGECPSRGGRVSRYATRHFFYPARIKLRTKADIVHILDHSWADMLPFTPRNSLKVITVHDLIPLRFPGELNPAQVRRFRQRVGHLTEADAVIAVSDYTKLEVENLLGISGEKIHVIMNGVELPDNNSAAPPLSPLVLREPGGTRFHIGSIGTILDRKNLTILPAALARLKAMTARKVVLVRVGQKLPIALATALKKELGDDGLVELGLIPDGALAGYYAGLDVLAVPSTYEGFGLPVLEGMAARVPVVSSNSSSLPEVGGENVLYFDPADPAALAHQLAVVAENRLPENWTDLAYERAKGFSWRKTLEGIYDVYQLALDQRSQRSV